MHDIASRFTRSAIHDIKELGNGLINDTFLVAAESQCFVLQRINRRVFAMPERIVANGSVLSEFIAQQRANDVKLRIPEMVKTISGDCFHRDAAGDVWRGLAYIDNTDCFETVTAIEQAEQVGFALGHFHRLTSDLPIERLHDTLPGFHITPSYLRHYRAVSRDSACANSCEIQFCQDFIESRSALANVLEEAKRSGLLVERVMHGDPKLNNFLFDKASGAVVSLIDLDTVKPGLVHYDIGDCLRSLCHIEASDTFDLDICEAVLTAYLAEAGAFFGENDYRYLYPSIRLIPFELGLRFFSDYLAGNVYFKVTEPEQNLHRAAAQFRLCESIEARQSVIERLIEHSIRKSRR